MKDLIQAAEDYASSKEKEWRSVVAIACGICPEINDRAARKLADRSRVGAKTLARKIASIQLAKSSGMTAEEITAAGQKRILGQFVVKKVAARTLPLVPFPHKLTPPVRDDLQTLCFRLGKVLGLKTYDEVFEFILSQFSVATDHELRHAAGGEDTASSAMTAQQLKAHLLMWARFKKQWALATLECDWSPGDGYNLADVMAVDDRSRIVEIEVKVTMSDLRNDLDKKAKHGCLRATFDAKSPQLTARFDGVLGIEHVDRMKNRIPARFYYAVPGGLRDQAKEFVDQNVPYAGLLSDGGWWHSVETVRRAPILHNVAPGLEEQWFIVKSQTSQFARAFRKLIEMNSQFVLRPSKDEIL